MSTVAHESFLAIKDTPVAALSAVRDRLAELADDGFAARDVLILIRSCATGWLATASALGDTA